MEQLRNSADSPLSPITRLEARDVDHAVELARMGRDRGQWDWFRGQIHDWPVVAKALRTDALTQEAVERLSLFSGWASSTPGLSSLAGDDISLLAVAQHYGIPTQLLDFTASPAVAGYFASDSPPDDTPTGPSVIICLNTAAYLEIVNKVDLPRLGIPWCLEIDVSDLWRLEAQSGRFLYAPFERIEGDIYTFDRIYFPHGSRFSELDEADVYPKQRSRLEQLLDQYFFVERVQPVRRAFEEVAAHGDAVSIDVSPSPESVVGTALSTHESWLTDALEPWLTPARERWVSRDNHLADSVVVRAETDDPRDLRDEIRQRIARELHQRPNLRQSHTNWQLRTNLSNDSARLHRTLTDMFNGVRRLPYTSDDIADGMGLLSVLVLPSSAVGEDALWKLSWFTEPLMVGFSSAGAHSSAIVEMAELRAALRSDIYRHVDEGSLTSVLSFQRLLMHVANPRELFELPRLASLWVRQIVPIELAFHSHLPCFYSPVDIEVFGIP